MMEGIKLVGSLEDWKGIECWSYRVEFSEKVNKMGDCKKVFDWIWEIKLGGRRDLVILSLRDGGEWREFVIFKDSSDIRKDF